MNFEEKFMPKILRIRSVSRLMSYFCWIPIVMIPLVILYGEEERATLSFEKKVEADGRYSYDFSYDGGGFDLSGDHKDEVFSSWKNFGFVVIRSLPSLALLASFIFIRRIFTIFSTGEFFTVATARNLKFFSISIIIFGLIRPLAYIEKDLIIRLEEAKSMEYYLEIPDAGGSFLFLGFSLLIISWVMGEAARLAEDNRSII